MAYPKTHVHTPNPIEYEQMKDAMRAAEYERITREKEKQDWSEFNKTFCRVTRQADYWTW